MKVSKNILSTLLFNSAISNIICNSCCPKKYNKNKEKETEIDTSKNEEDKKREEEGIKNKMQENLRKINNVKEEKIKEENIKEIISKNINIEPPKGDKYYDELIKKMNDGAEEGNTEKIKDIPVTGNDTGKGKAKYKSILNEFKEDPKIGLDNIGATCYMNATLQCFSHIPRLVDYFKYKYNPKIKGESNLSSSFKLLIDNLWSKDSTEGHYAPRDFKEKISAMNALFAGVAANDSKDLVNFIIMTLHTELNKSKSADEYNPAILDQRDSSKMFYTFAENFTKSNRSIISDLFYGVNCNITQCGSCGTQSYNYQTYFFLVFPLEEVRRYNSAMYNSLYYYNTNPYYNYYCNQPMLYNIQNNIVNIYDCFNYEAKINTMYADNAMYCNYCKQTCQANMQTVLTIGPEVLILILNRGQGIQYDVKLLFNDTLDLTDYIHCKNLGTKYKLIGVITHLGSSDMGGHFIAYCKDPINGQFNGQWYRFNDAKVTPVTDFKKDVIDFGMPYLLFYEKIKE